MKKRALIGLIYLAVGVVAVGIFSLSYWIKKGQQKEFYYKPVSQVPSIYFKIQNDLVAHNQHGEEVKISQLKGKVWLFTQFFISCPQCLDRNLQDLKKIYNHFKDNPHFQIVSLSLNPKEDTVPKLQEYIKKYLQVDDSQWWMLTGNEEKLRQYAEKELKLFKIKERTDQNEIQAKGKFAHDLGLVIFDENWQMRAKYNLHRAKHQGKEAYQQARKSLYRDIEYLLKNR